MWLAAAAVLLAAAMGVTGATELVLYGGPLLFIAGLLLSGRFIGEAGFHDLKRDIEPSLEGIPEAGWALAPQAHGKGLASEIVRRALAWGDETFAGDRTVCIIDPENTGSLNVAAKCGYTKVLETTYHDGPTILLERLV